MINNLKYEFFLALWNRNGNETASFYTSSTDVTCASSASINQSKRNRHSQFELAEVKICVQKIIKLVGLSEQVGFEF